MSKPESKTANWLRCAGCAKGVKEGDEITFHKRSVGDVPFCSERCADENLERVWRELP